MIFNWAPVGGVIIDLIIIAYIAISSYLGCKKGLIELVTKIIAFIIAIVIALILFQPIASFLTNHTGLKAFFSSDFKTVLSKTSLVDGELISEDQTNLPVSIVKFINNQTQTVINNGQEAIIDSVSDSLAVYIIKIIAGFTVFLIVRIGLIFAQSVLSIFTKLPIIGPLNKIGGGIYGFLKALIIVYLVFLVLSVIATFISNWTLLYAIDASHIGSILYHHNLIMNLFAR